LVKTFLKGDKMKAKIFWVSGVVTLCCAMVLVCVTKADPKADFEKQKISKYSTRIPKYTTTVKLEIEAVEDLKDPIYSYISKELRSFGDVTIVDYNAEWTVAMKATEILLKDGTKTGHIAISTIGTQPVPFYKVFQYIIEESAYQYLKRCCKRYNNLVYHQLNISNKGNLQNTCKKIVVDFDVDVLEPARKKRQEMVDYLLQQEEERQ